MTLGARKKSLVYSFYILLAVLIVCIVFALILQFSSKYELSTYEDRYVLQTLVLAAFLLAASITMILSFRKTVGPEVFFYIIFIFSLSFECLKSILLFFMISNQPSYFLVIFSKIIHSTRVFTLFSLFSASLFCTGLETRRIVNILAIISFGAVFFGLNIIVTSKDPGAFLVFSPGYKTELYFFFIIVLFFHFLNYIYGTVKTGSPDFLILGGASLLSAVGTIMIYFSFSFLFFLAGILVLAAGIAFYAIKIHSIYLWI